MIQKLTIRKIGPGEHATCERILRSLPDWFGIEAAIVEYVRNLEVMETWLAETTDGPVGFLTLNDRSETASEIHVLGVIESQHRQGWGRRLVEHAEKTLRARKIEFLEVKTLAPTRESRPYERTRKFYLGMGFKPLEENRLWGESNPCLVMIKHLDAAQPAQLRNTLIANLKRSNDLYRELAEGIPEKALGEKLPELRSNTIGQQLWCVVGARESFARAIKDGSWAGFSCSLTGEGCLLRAEVLAALDVSARMILDVLPTIEESDQPRCQFALDLLEHEASHHGQLIRYIYGLDLEIPTSWKKKYALG